MPAPSPDRIVVLHSPDAPGYLDVREGSPTGPQMATAFRSGGPGSATIGPGETTISAPAPAPPGTRRLLIDAAGEMHGYLEYRWQVSAARTVIALVAGSDLGVRAWTRERSALRAALGRLRPTAAAVPAAIMIGQDERGSIDPIAGGHVLTWHGTERLTRHESLLLAVAPLLGARA